MLRDSIEEAEDFHWKIQMKYHYILHPPPEEEEDPEERKARRAVPGTTAGKVTRARAAGLPDLWDKDRALQQEWVPAEMQRAGMHELSISCINARVAFGYEYIGNQ